MVAPISVYDRPRLVDYWRANVPAPRWRPWFRAIDIVPDELEVSAGGVPVKVGGFSRVFRSMTLSSRITFVAYYWLYPFDPSTSLHPGLDKLFLEGGVEHLDRTLLLKCISDECDRYVRSYPEAANWVRSRVALLEFKRDQERPNPVSPVLHLLRNQLLRVVNLLWQDPASGVELADDLLDQALRGAAQVVHGVLGGDSKGQLNATLMLPVRDPQEMIAALASMGLQAHDGDRRANAIWQRLPSKPQAYLVVVGGTQGDEHLGFWVPVVEGDRGKRLPGASEAFANHIGSAVFRHDVPKLDGFSEEVNARWSEHIRARIRGRHFVSIPLLVERNQGLGSVVPAVVNVSADPGEGREWYRALHEEWLECAREAAAPFIEVALFAMQARLAVGGTASLQLDILAPEWRRLPGISYSTLAIGASDE